MISVLPADRSRVFLVEHDADSLEMLALYVRELGYEVVGCFGTMREALAALTRTGIDVLICDLGLPDGDGWELLRRAGLSPQVCCVALSPFGRSADLPRSEQAGYYYHLHKPFVPEALSRILEGCAGKGQSCPA